jgi:hypothetical protein
MEWSVVKMGIPMFDALHTYGLAVLLATASGQPVEINDAGLPPHSGKPSAEVTVRSCFVELRKQWPSSIFHCP